MYVLHAQVRYEDGQEEVILLAMEQIRLPAHLCPKSANALPSPSATELRLLAENLQAKAIEFTTHASSLEHKRGTRDEQKAAYDEGVYQCILFSFDQRCTHLMIHVK